MKYLVIISILLAGAGASLAQDRDFLTPDETDQVREVQEPNKRLMLYIKFAQLRMDLLKTMLANPKPGRSLFIHDTLEDLTNLIEAMDTVSDDAIRRRINIEPGLAAVVEAEKPMIEELNKVIDSQPKDYSRYKFTMEQAVATLKDSSDLAGEDLKSRGAALAKQDKRDKQERDEIGDETDAKAAAQKATDKKASATNPAKAPRKAPTLYRKGEVAPDKQQQ
ncbi:MAG TPA: hypothetical protein VGL53_06665 [Bryobacteraceae bacterium]|jgi:hypothetical protein